MKQYTGKEDSGGDVKGNKGNLITILGKGVLDLYPFLENNLSHRVDEFYVLPITHTGPDKIGSMAGKTGALRLRLQLPGLSEVYTLHSSYNSLVEDV